MITKLIVSQLLLFCLATPLLACLWDFDTIKMERQLFPGTLELITGKFLRHSPEFYQWRVEDRLKKIENGDSDLDVFDDLAVAYDKLGQHDQAVAVALGQLEREPDRYQTNANLGTFYIHQGHWELGLEYIDRALEINPDAHFGRERYQKWLVEYLIDRFPDGKVKLPVSESDGESNGSFATFLDTREKAAGISNSKQGHRDSAVKGVLGMMRFGNHDSPILLEVLADLLVDGSGQTNDAKQLAARALLRASYQTDGDTRWAYRKRAKEALEMQSQYYRSDLGADLGKLEAELAEEIEQADAFYQQIVDDERQWIAAGKNPELEYSKKYYQEPEVTLEQGYGWAPLWLGLAGGVILLAIMMRNRNQKPQRLSWSDIANEKSKP